MLPISSSPAEHPHPPIPFPTATASLLDGSSSLTVSLRSRLRQIAPFFRTALIRGEAGAGKQRVARELHRLRCPLGPFVRHSGRGRNPEVSPLLGPLANPQWPACLKSAQGGVLLLDEVSDLSMPEQTSLLQHLQGRDWKSLAEANRAKIVGSTRFDPKLLVATGRLHRDLYALLSAVDIQVSPLRERLDDLPDLIGSLLSDTSALGSEPKQFSAESLDRLRARTWYGNIAELRSMLQQSERIGFEPKRAEDIGAVSVQGTSMPEHTPASMRLQDLIDAHVSRVLALCGGNKLRAAEILGVSRSTLYRMLAEMVKEASDSLRP